MSYMKYMLMIVGVFALGGCASRDCEPGKLRTGYALPGTETVVVGISLDKNGMPQESYKDVKVHPGQKVLYAGPDEFAIVFKNKKTPNGRVENKSSRGVVVIQIPEDIFERPEFIEEFRKNKTLTFNYGIRANGKELDPPMVVHPR
ncbi:MAG: hypothetical protein Q7T48_01385 [Cellvibrio sp.]|jgi:hypothetical protein|uniref:hypothetical protein n=1 Tax=Cellvibrio sp. TaxID=1965322 RepID=UPI002725063C|nr:hypothetical protein [Cellvibrio sp.]